MLYSFVQGDFFKCKRLSALLFNKLLAARKRGQLIRDDCIVLLNPFDVDQTRKTEGEMWVKLGKPTVFSRLPRSLCGNICTADQYCVLLGNQHDVQKPFKRPLKGWSTYAAQSVTQGCCQQILWIFHPKKFPTPFRGVYEKKKYCSIKKM